MTERTLIVYYSRSGTTGRIARQLAHQLAADIDEIRVESNRMSAGGYLRCLLEAIAKGLPSMQTRHDPRDYDRVIIGTPVWAGTVASPVRSYLCLHHGKLPKLSFFATMGGRGAEAVLAEMKLLCAAEDAPCFFATQAEVERDGARGKIDEFVRLLTTGQTGTRPSVAA